MNRNFKIYQLKEKCGSYLDLDLNQQLKKKNETTGEI